MNIGKYSIRKKLTWMNLLVSSTDAADRVIGICGVYELATLRLAMVRNLSIQAQIVGANCASAVEFDDPDSARSTLSALNAAPDIMSVSIYTASSGAPFAAWVRLPGGVPEPSPPAASGQSETYRFTGSSLLLVRPIVFQGKRSALSISAPT